MAANASRIDAELDKGREVKGLSRLSLVFPVETRNRLEALKAGTGSPSLTDTITNAIRVYEWVASVEKQRGKILVQMPGEEVEVVKFVL